MHDIKFIRTSPQSFDDGLKKRGLAPLSAKILEIDIAKREQQTAKQELENERNKLAKEYGMAKAKGGDVAALGERAEKIKSELAAKEAALEQVEKQVADILSTIPNLPAEDVPLGADEKGNQQVRIHGEKPVFAFKPKEHFDIGEKLGVLDFERAGAMSGTRFAVLKGDLARLERALASFMLDIHTTGFGYTEVVPPFLVRDNAVYGTGQLPKFADDLFKTTDGYWLIPTAEVSLTNLVNDTIVKEEDLPLRYTAYTPCFRAEAGAAGKDTRGLIRQHQFSKVELVSIVHPDTSQQEHERMTNCAEEILRQLGLHFRTMLLCTGDMGFCSTKTYDIEVWLPGQDAFREISSCSNCGDFQARRMKARFKGAKGNEFVHTLNGSGLAVGRTMVAILENYQQEDGTVRVPDALVPYMGGKKVIAG